MVVCIDTFSLAIELDYHVVKYTSSGQNAKRSKLQKNGFAKG